MKGLIILRIIIGKNTLKYMEIAIIYDPSWRKFGIHTNTITFFTSKSR